MSCSHSSPGTRRIPALFFNLITLLILSSLVLSLAGCSQATPTRLTETPTVTIPPTATPTPAPQTLPPALVETDPLPGAQIALQNPITFYFNQPMQRASVEAAVTGEPSLVGKFSWKDDSTVTFTPDKALEPGSSQVINIATTAQSAKGLALQQPISLSFDASSYLMLTESLPAPDTQEVDPTSAIVASFNQPVVALGADPASLPAGFVLAPTASGKGEWINTSTYIFYPAPALAGGMHYYVSINPSLTSTSGAPMKSITSWAFDTILPRLVSGTPFDGTENVRLDSAVRLDFSYSMDKASVEANFSLQTSDGIPVDGTSGWNDKFTTFAYTPIVLLDRDTTYTAELNSSAAALGGTPLGNQIQQTWRTVSDLSITGSVPAEGGTKAQYEGVGLILSSYVDASNIKDYLTFDPEVPGFGTWMDEGSMTLYANGTFDPDTDYSLTVSPELTDLWGSKLGQSFTLHFRSGALNASVQFPYSSDSASLTTQDTGILALVTNTPSIPISVGTLSIEDLVKIQDPYNYENRQNFFPADAVSWTFYPDMPPNKATPVTIPVAPDGRPLPAGLYFMRLSLPNSYGYDTTFILAVSPYQVTFKTSPTEAFVWAVDLATNTPVADLPATVYDNAGNVLSSGQTGEDGVFEGPVKTDQESIYSTFVVLGEQGTDNFGFAMQYWDEGVTPWNFDLTVRNYPSDITGYLYTDRPIYRPGDTVHFRLVARQFSNGHYVLPYISSYHLEIHGPAGEQLAGFEVPLSEYGTGDGEYTLPIDATPGNYNIDNHDYTTYTWFQVAEYRKPQIDLQVAFQSTEVLSGTHLLAGINARYFYDAPANNQPVQWALYRQTSYFDIPNYQVGPVDTSWLDVYNYNFPPYGLGELISSGDVRTDANGLASVSITPPGMPGRQEYILEVTLTDESDQPVSARASAYVNPADYYIGVHPDAWSYEAKEQAGFSILVSDWEGNPAGEKELTAQFRGVTWERHDPPEDNLGYMFPTYQAVYTPVATTTLTTATDGTGRVTFTPPQAGTYQLDVSGGGTLTQVIIWVGGAGTGVWPSLPNQRIRLVPDKDGYQAGDTAQVFVPNPFNDTALGLLTVERGTILDYQILHLEPGGSTIPIALTQEAAPNIYVAVTLLGSGEQGYPDFRQGYTNLPVDPSFNYLTVNLTSTPERSGPGEPVSFNLRITDADGKPVEGEFSLAVVDKAIFSLADPYEADIYNAFYGIQPLSVQTGISLAASGQRLRYMPGGMGGGGGGEAPAPVTRENFPDTAYWNAQIRTDANGEGTVIINLPDSLTTWQVLVRGLTKDTLVGETKIEVITTKELLINPTTPRFLVVGDHAQVSAVVQNNTSAALEGTATLQAAGFNLDDPNQMTQPVNVPAYERVRLEWWGTTEDVASASLRFSVQAGNLQDAILVANGALPVLRYTAPQTFATSGSLPEAGERLELVSLPASFDASQGTLEVELDPSLAAAMLDSLEALNYYPSECTEPILSSFLPNLVTYTTLQGFGIEAPVLKASLDNNLKPALDKLLVLQHPDGGWGWCQEGVSDAYISSYVLYGLATSQAAGINVPSDTISNTVGYINSSLITPDSTAKAWMLDRQAFENYALKQAGAGNLESANELYQVRDRLSPWAEAFLALSLDPTSSSSDAVPTLVSDLQSTAIRSATGVHWEVTNPDWNNMTSTLSNSAIVLYALAQLEPDSTLIPDAVNYLMSNRQANGCWNSTYEDSWILLAMDEVMKSTGELNSSYTFGANLNGNQIASGEAGGETQLNPVTTSLPISSLYPNDPNSLTIQRQAGDGRLYYTADLNVSRPAEDVAPFNGGVSISRAYYPYGSDLSTTTPISATQVGDKVVVRLVIVLPTDVYHFKVEDHIPAGTEIYNTNIKTTQMGDMGEPVPLYDSTDPFSTGWEWWLFDAARIYDDHISWSASYLLAGTYELTYTLDVLQAGEYHLLPAHAWQVYFPEVQGNSAGGVLEIKP